MSETTWISIPHFYMLVWLNLQQTKQIKKISTDLHQINMILTNRDNIPSQTLHIPILNPILPNINNNINKTIKLLINFVHRTQNNGVINN